MTDCQKLQRTLLKSLHSSEKFNDYKVVDCLAARIEYDGIIISDEGYGSWFYIKDYFDTNEYRTLQVRSADPSITTGRNNV